MGNSGVSLTPGIRGAALTVPHVTDLAALDVSGMTVGTHVYALDAAADFVLCLSTSTVDHTTVEAVAGYTGYRWLVSGVSSEIIYGPPPPFEPLFWFDANDVDGKGNSTLADGATVTTWVNKGRYLESGAAVPATRSAGSLVLKKLAASGRVRNLASVASDATGVMATGTITALSATCTIAMVFKGGQNFNGVAGGAIGLCDGAGRTAIWVLAPSGGLTIGGGAGVASGLFVNAQTYHTVVVVYNGASSSANVDGVQGGNVTPSNGGLTTIQLFSLVTGVDPGDTEICQYVLWKGAQDQTTILNWLAAMVGRTPQ